MIMKKNLLFILFLVMPIALIGISIYNKDIERIERAFYFLSINMRSIYYVFLRKRLK